MSVAITTDTNSGIMAEEGARLGVHVIPMPVLIDGNIYYVFRSVLGSISGEKQSQLQGPFNTKKEDHRLCPRRCNWNRNLGWPQIHSSILHDI